MSKISSTQLSDNELISNVKNDACDDSFLELCRRYENVFYKICQKYAPTLVACGINPTDIYEEKTFIIYSCIKSFDSSKNTKFSTWIGNYARYLCLNSINAKRLIIPSSSDEVHNHIESKQIQDEYEKSASADNLKLFIREIVGDIKDARIASIIKMRYLDDDKKAHWKEIAKKMNISSQTAIYLHHRGMKTIKRKLSRAIAEDVI